MSDVIEEINEDLRRQQLEKFWKENGSWIIFGVFLAIIFTGALTWWREHEYQANLAQTAALIEVLNGPDVEKITEFADKTDKDHAVIARFSAASIYAKRHDTDKALAIYNALENTTGIDRSYRDLARLLSVGLRLETADPALLHKDLSMLTGQGNAWRYSALEMEALLYAREGKLKEAAADLATLTADAGAPADVRMRASTLRELYVGTAPDAAPKGKNG